jgi:protein gp37
MGREPFQGPMRSRTWRGPLKWNRQAAAEGRRQRVFACSLSDFFHPDADQCRDEAWGLKRECENLDWLILTKRPELIPDRMPADWGRGYLNVWLGVTVENADYLHRIDQLLRIPADSVREFPSIWRKTNDR